MPRTDLTTWPNWPSCPPQTPYPSIAWLNHIYHNAPAPGPLHPPRIQPTLTNRPSPPLIVWNLPFDTLPAPHGRSMFMRHIERVYFTGREQFVGEEKVDVKQGNKVDVVRARYTTAKFHEWLQWGLERRRSKHGDQSPTRKARRDLSLFRWAPAYDIMECRTEAEARRAAHEKSLTWRARLLRERKSVEAKDRKEKEMKERKKEESKERKREYMRTKRAAVKEKKERKRFKARERYVAAKARREAATAFEAQN
ncbi:hypothetical protein BT63DRAFT_428310, partial [Microthyrium microscopicum]